MQVQNNPLLCNPESGVCELPHVAQDSARNALKTSPKALKIIYFTDPICSSCWGIEPQLRKLKLEYSAAFDIEYRMGGLLPDWSYNSGGISKPADVAHHWDEVSAYYQMPIDGDIWLENPLHSSFPPSIAFKAAQLQSPEKALVFLRHIREMVFLEKKNITQWPHLAEAALAAQLDTARLHADFSGAGQQQFEQDLQLARRLGVRGFPTLILVNANNEQRIVYGFRPYSQFEQAVLQLVPQIQKTTYDNSAQALFTTFGSLTAREYAELSGQPPQQAVAVLNRLVAENYLSRLDTKNGAIWRRR